MNPKYLKSTAIISMIILGLFASSAVAATYTQRDQSATVDTYSILLEENDCSINLIEVEKLKERIPLSLEEAEARITRLNRFLMWTHDGKHIMWGFVGNGFFVGKDNAGKHCWGIYGKGVFAGFYDKEFFYGRYSQGRWKAVDLFGEENTYGKYIIFPEISEIDITAEKLP